MLVLTLLHLLEVRRFFDFLHLCLRVLYTILLPVDIVFYMVLFVLLGFKASLHLVKLLFFRFNLTSDQVILLSKLAHGHRNFFYLFSAALPTRDHIVGFEQCRCRHKLRLLFVLGFPITEPRDLLVFVKHCHVGLHLVVRWLLRARAWLRSLRLLF